MIKEVLWDSRIFCCQSMVHSDDTCMMSLWSDMFFVIAVCSVVRDVLWDSKIFCNQSVVHWDDSMFSGQRCSLG